MRTVGQEVELDEFDCWGLQPQGLQGCEIRDFHTSLQSILHVQFWF